MKTKHAPQAEIPSIKTTQLDEVVGGCACGCGMADCSCTNGSCGGATAASRRSRFNFNRR